MLKSLKVCRNKKGWESLPYKNKPLTVYEGEEEDFKVILAEFNHFKKIIIFF